MRRQKILMQNILFLVHRIPYPPNKGDKIRSFHFLKALSRHFNVFLGTFIDDEEDWRYRAELDAYCRDVACLPLHPSRARLFSLSGLLTGMPLSQPYYRSDQLQQWVDRTIAEHNIEKTVVFSSVMGQFVADKPNMKIYADFVDVDSDKWRQYAEKKRWPESWIYRRESVKLLDYEKKLAQRAEFTTFVSSQEAELFSQLAPECAARVGSINNGVNVDYFTPEADLSNPYTAGGRVMVFTGAMDYWANVDAVVWFVEEVMPLIRHQLPEARFYIVGSKPDKRVRELVDDKNVFVTGRVEDIRPYLAHAAFAVAPLRIARGIQNKVLEAMAMAKTVLASSAAMEGIEHYPQKNVVVTDAPQAMAEQACRLLGQTDPELTARGNRDFVESHYSWHSSGEQLVKLIES